MKKLKELFENYKNLSADDIQTIVSEALKTLEKATLQMQSNDPADRANGKKIAEELRETLLFYSQHIIKELGMTDEDLKTFVENKNNFSDEQWGVFKQAKDELSAYQKNLAEKGLIEAPKIPKPKKKKLRNKLLIG